MPSFANIRRGFTLIELMVSVAIIGILTAILVTGQVQQKHVSLVRRASEQILNDIQAMQNSALSGQTVGGTRPSGFGLTETTSLSGGQYFYTTFSDTCSPSPCTANNIGDAGETLQTVKFDPVLRVQRLCTNLTTCAGAGTVTRLDINYLVPNAKVVITPTPVVAGTVTVATIILVNPKLNLCYAVTIDAVSGSVSNRQLTTC